MCQASKCRQQHAAVVVRKGKIVSISVNYDKNNPKTVSCLSALSVHAEVRALRKLKNTKGVTVYVARMYKNGKPALSRPCGDCSVYLANAGVRRVVHT